MIGSNGKNGGEVRSSSSEKGRIVGIMVTPGRAAEGDRSSPRIQAFIWGGKVRPTPTLPFGRWKGAA